MTAWSPQSPSTGTHSMPGKSRRSSAVMVSKASSSISTRAMPFGAVAGALPAQLGTDRAARPGHQDRTPAQPAADRLPVRAARLPAEQVLDRDFLQLTGQRAPFQHVGESRHRAERQMAFLAQHDHPAHDRGVDRRHGDHQQLGAGLPGDARHFRDPAQHRQALQAGAAQRCRVVQEADRVIAPEPAQIAHQGLAGLARAKDQHPLRALGGLLQPVVFPGPEDQSWRTEQHGEHERIQQERRARDQFKAAVEEQADHYRQQPQHAGLEDIEQVGNAGEAPQPPVQAHPPGHQALGDHHDGDGVGKGGEIERGRLQRIAQVVQSLPADPHHRKIVHHHRHARQPVREAILPCTHQPIPSLPFPGLRCRRSHAAIDSPKKAAVPTQAQTSGTR